MNLERTLLLRDAAGCPLDRHDTLGYGRVPVCGSCILNPKRVLMQALNSIQTKLLIDLGATACKSHRVLQPMRNVSRLGATLFKNGQQNAV